MARRAIDAGIIADGDAAQATTTPRAFEAAAERACKAPLSDVSVAFPSVRRDGESFLCLDLSFQYVLLTTGLKLEPDAEVTLVRRVKYQGEWFEAAWPLGAAINTLSSATPPQRRRRLASLT